MGKMADSWKKAKDNAEKLCKQKQKEGRKAEFPKFKSDFQKTLDSFESAYELREKLQQKLDEQSKAVDKLADECKSIVKEYEKAIDKAEVEGLKSKEEVKDPLLSVLSKIDTLIGKMSKG